MRLLDEYGPLIVGLIFILDCGLMGGGLYVMHISEDETSYLIGTIMLYVGLAALLIGSVWVFFKYKKI